MLFRDLVGTSRAVGDTRSRRQKIEHLAGLLGRLAPDEVRPAVAWLAGLVPQGKLGVGWATVSSLPREGEGAGEPLAIVEVDRALGELAAAAGPGSSGQRKQVLGALWARAGAAERDFLVRLLTGELRQGALEGIMAEAVARAGGADPGRVRRAMMLSGDIAEVARAALAGGDAGLGEFRVELFRPLLPMLAQPADDVADAVARLGEASFEYKLDGARVQLHKRGDQVRVYSRGLNEVTGSVPELVAAAPTRSRSPCAASAASSTSPPCRRSCRSAPGSSTAC